MIVAYAIGRRARGVGWLEPRPVRDRRTVSMIEAEAAAGIRFFEIMIRESSWSAGKHPEPGKEEEDNMMRSRKGRNFAPSADGREGRRGGRP